MVNLRNRKRTRESEPSVPENSNRAGLRSKIKNFVRGSPDSNAMANDSSVVMRIPRPDNFNENEGTVSLVSELSNSSILQHHETPVSVPQSISGFSIFSTGTLDINKISKLVREIIPTFDGKKMSVKMFNEHCRAAISLVNPSEIPYLTLMTRTKITGEARIHVQDRLGATLDEILQTLTQIYSQKQDISQLMQDLSNVIRNPEETIPEYGAQVSLTLNKLIFQVLENTPREEDIGMCKAYKTTAIENFLRGLDYNLYNQIRDKEITSLEQAIAFANKEDLRLKSWQRVHGEIIETTSSSNFQSANNSYLGFSSHKRIAHLRAEGKSEATGGRKSEFKCCKEVGHFKRDYPKPYYLTTL